MDIGSWFTEIAAPLSSNRNSYAQSVQKSLAAERIARKALADAQSSVESPATLATPSDTVTFSGQARRHSIAQRALTCLPAEAVAEAQKRVEAGFETANMAMLPENKALFDTLGEEMKKCNFSTEEGRSRAATLGNMQAGLQRAGWKEPMTREQALFESQVGAAMGHIDTLHGKHDAYWDGMDQAILSAKPEDIDRTMQEYERNWAAGRPEPARYAEKSLTMPRTSYYKLPDMAKAAGISEEEFAATAREYAGTMQEPELYFAMEAFISSRYAG